MLLTITAIAAAVMLGAATSLLWMLVHERRRREAAERENESFRQRARTLQDAEAEARRLTSEAEAAAERARATAAAEDERRARVAAEAGELEERLASLREELESVEEHGRLQAQGMYRPHYDFGTPERFKQEEEWLRSLQAMMLKEGTAARCESADGTPAARAVLTLMLRAFNGECNAAIARVTRDNLPAMEARTRKAFEGINRTAAGFRCQLAEKYLELKLSELRLAHEFHEKLNAAGR